MRRLTLDGRPTALKHGAATTDVPKYGKYLQAVSVPPELWPCDLVAIRVLADGHPVVTLRKEVARVEKLDVSAWAHRLEVRFEYSPGGDYLGNPSCVWEEDEDAESEDEWDADWREVVRRKPMRPCRETVHVPDVEFTFSSETYVDHGDQVGLSTWPPFF